MAVLKDHSIEISGRGAEIENEWVEQAECRICQEEEQKINLEVPCGCSGTAKYAHRKCVQRWCNEKGNTVCEICHQPYRSGYTANPRHGECDRTGLIHLRDQWAVGEELQEFAEERFWGLDDEDYSAINSATAASCRSAAIILLPLLLIRHVIAVAAVANAEEYSSLLSILFVFRVAGFLLPCYILARAMIILRRRMRRQN